jgi:hypothetical protein
MHENAKIDDGIDVSSHAKLRWLQRAGGSAAGNVADQIRQRLADATPTTEQIDDGQGWRIGDSIIVVTDPNVECVRTVLTDHSTGGGK